MAHFLRFSLFRLLHQQKFALYQCISIKLVNRVNTYINFLYNCTLIIYI